MPQPDEATPTPQVLVVELAEATELVIEPGRAFETYPYTEQPELLVVRDVQAVQQLVMELATADLRPGVVVPVLDGLTLTFRDADGGYLATLGLLTPRWVRYWWRSDALLPEPLSLLRDEEGKLDQYLRDGWRGVDAVTPAHAAARDGDGIEHALEDEGTLCGLPRADVDVYRHHFAFRPQDCPECYRCAWTQKTGPLWPRMFKTAPALSQQWAARWGATPPVGHLLRGGETWVRFHSLPESKRYAETPSEYDELLYRHHTVLRELAAITSSDEVLVLTHSWASSTLPVPQPAPLQAAVPGSEYWSSFQDPDDSAGDVWHHVFINRLRLTAETLDPLLRLAADFGTSAVIICDEDLTWFFHPYDGGADVIPATTAQRDELKSLHSEWLPLTESGL